MAKNSKQIDSLSIDDSIMGAVGEDFVEEGLQELARMRQISHYYRSTPNGELDRLGIDFMVFPEPDWIIPLQVKRSYRNIGRHYRIHPNIPCVVATYEDDLSTIMRKTLAALGLSTDEVLANIALEREQEPPGPDCA